LLAIGAAVAFRGEGAGEGPSIVVHTEFPTGVVTSSKVDITYTAIPSEGAEVDWVEYYADGSYADTIYSRMRASDDPRGRLGEGFVHLSPNVVENIVVVMQDTAGRQAEFAIENHAYYDFGAADDWPDSETKGSMPIRPFTREGYGNNYRANSIIVMAWEGVSRKEVETIAAAIDGVVLGAMPRLDLYYIRIGEDSGKELTEDELLALRDYLESTYADKVAFAMFDSYSAIADAVPGGPGADYSMPRHTLTRNEGGASYPLVTLLTLPVALMLLILPLFGRHMALRSGVKAKMAAGESE
jgi:hypothetical protein